MQNLITNKVSKIRLLSSTEQTKIQGGCGCTEEKRRIVKIRKPNTATTTDILVIDTTVTLIITPVI
jgi:hypothetical protein